MLFATLYQMHRLSETEHWLSATGKIISLTSDGCPTVEFSVPPDTFVTFSPGGCSTIGYSVGDVGAVLYDPGNPRRAHFDSFMENWFLSLMLGIFGLFFLLIGWMLFLPERSVNKRRRRLQRRGSRVQARLLEVRRDPSFTFNGVPAWQLVCQWQNPATGNVHLFYSDSLWYDPQPFIKGKSLQVLIDPEKPGYHWVDTDFLPKLAL